MKTIPFHSLTLTEILKKFNATQDGIDSKERAIRIEKYGKNELEKEEKISLIGLFVSQFLDFLIGLLIVSAIVSLIIGDTTEGIAILFVVMLNAFIGFFQELKAEKSIKALTSLQETHALVKTPHDEKNINSKNIVPGDIVLLSEGNRVPADGYLIEAKRLSIDESMLTGESIPSNKKTGQLDENIAISDRTNVVYSGTIVTRGRGIFVVFATGMNTEIGVISKLVSQGENGKSPLQQSVDKLGKILGIIVLLLTIPAMVAGYLHGYALKEMFLLAISLGVAAVPEGLPIMVTIALSLGTKRMLDHAVLIRKLPVVETLGSTQVIFTDKTGTLTKNQMELKKIIWFEHKSSFIREVEIRKTFSDHEKFLLEHGALVSDSMGKVGDPTELAITRPLSGAVDIEKLRNHYPRLDEIPFNSDNKWMATLCNFGKSNTIFIKGAFQEVLDRCSHFRTQDGKYLMTDQFKKSVTQRVEELSLEGLRVLAIATKNTKEVDLVDAPEGLALESVIAMMDPPREDVKDAIASCYSAGVDIVMITGDHKLTAISIAKAVGMKNPKGINGRELDIASDKERESLIENHNVFSRVSPQNKIQILMHHKSKGKIVGMTGDGVNDSPAIKAADIGISVGSGTDIAKDVSDMILTEDNFSSIERAIFEGRSIFENIKKFLRVLIATNLSEIFIVFFALLMGLPLILLPIQLLWLNLVTDSLPALSLTVDPNSEELMSRKPRDPRQSIIKGIFFIAFVRAVLATLTILLAFEVALNMFESYEVAQTIAFTSLIVLELISSIGFRSIRVTKFHEYFNNKYLVGSIVLGVVLQFFLIYTPILHDIFHTVSLTLFQLSFAFFTSLSTFIFFEILKYFKIFGSKE